MSFILFILAGVVGGVLGGMGMGGGTLLIPVLTLVLGVDQRVAQAANLIAFLPTSVIALSIHSKQGLVKGEGLFPIIIPAVALSVLGSLLASFLPSELLRKLFGAFLIALAIMQFFSAKHENNSL